MPMETPPTAPAVRDRFDALGEALADRGVSPGKMFGVPCLKARDKTFASLWGDAVVFKLAPPVLAEALALGGAESFDPSGMGRAMKEWVVVPEAHASRWLGFAESSLGYVLRLKEGTT